MFSIRLKSLISYPSDHIEHDIIWNHEQKIRLNKSENPRFYGQNKLPFKIWRPLLEENPNWSDVIMC
jgi:hypothetical protein